MTRVPEFSPNPIEPIVRLTQFRNDGYTLISHCSSGRGHEPVLVYGNLIAQMGDVEVDYNFKQAISCPECGAPAAG